MLVTLEILLLVLQLNSGLSRCTESISHNGFM